MVFKETGKLHWYQKTSLVLLISFFFLVITLCIAFGLLTLNFWWQIKQGKGDALQERLFQNSTVIQTKSISSIRRMVESSDDPFLGNINAEIVIVVFIDFKCPVCKEFSSTIHRINSHFGDKVKIIVRDFPLESMYTNTNKLAYFANCANDQEKYWGAHDLLFLIQDELSEDISDDYISGLATRLKLDKNKFDSCFKDSEIAFEVIKDFDDGMASGVEGTPTFFVNGEKIEGLVPWESWKNYLEKL